MTAQHTILGREEALQLLSACKQRIESKYGVTALGLFGSLARNQATEASDVDVVVQLVNPDLFTLVHIKDELEIVFNRHVDLLHYREKMNPYLKRHIEQEVLYV